MTDAQVSTIGKRIALYRRFMGIGTAQDLADLIDNERITASVIQNIESGRKPDLAVSQLLDISKALGISPLFLLISVGQPEQKLDLPNVGDSVSDMTMHEFDDWLSVAMVEDVAEIRPQASLRKIVRGIRRTYGLLADFEREVANFDPHEGVYQSLADDGTVLAEWDPRDQTIGTIDRLTRQIDQMHAFLSHYNVDVSFIRRSWLGSDGSRIDYLPPITPRDINHG